MDNSSVSLEVKDPKKNNTLKYIIIFIIVLCIGVIAGVFLAHQYLENKDSKTDNSNISDDANVTDITDDTAYVDLINKAYNIVKDNSVFYNSNGIDIKTLDNGTKLLLVYEYVLNKNLFTKDNLLVIGNGLCDYNFVEDPIPDGQSISSNICSVMKINAADLLTASKTLFNDETINVNSNFSPTSSSSCIVNNGVYICGNIISNTTTGALEPHFEIQKVTLANDGTIEIYDKGYLVDKRSGVDNPNDQYENYYLHSSDSTNYYYELKSADNLVFKHTFATKDNVNYYYVKTSVVKN